MELPTNKVIFSGVQPSGVIHIGNYLGAIKQWVALQENNTCYFCIVDEHAITVPYEPKDLARNVIAAAALYIACGLDINKSVIFVQSHVAAHTEMAWLLSSVAPFSEMSRMTQFKDKAKKIYKENANLIADTLEELQKKLKIKNTDEFLKKIKSNEAIVKDIQSFMSGFGASLGLFSYPVLMAADILLYKTQIVPVGEDQVQHLELTRDLANKFNNRFGNTLTVPETFLPQHTARIMSLSDPSKKMSKSDAPKSYLALTDTPEVIKEKISSAVTDTEAIFSFTKSGPAVKNLLTIYKAFSEQSEADIEALFAGKNYKEFKEKLADLLIEKLKPIRDKYDDLRRDDTELRLILGRGMHNAQNIANRTLQDTKEKMGLM